jgi:Flp pilus assembly pilin Flp
VQEGKPEETMSQPTTLPARTFRHLLRSPRGQAMVEYSVVAHMILVGGTAVGFPFLAKLLNALTKYYESIYWVLTSPIP